MKLDKLIVDNFCSHEHTEIDFNNVTSEQLLKKFPEIDVIINLAGICCKDSDGLLKYFDKIMNINLKPNFIILEYVKKLKNRPVNIIFISSSSATKGREGLTLYSSAKAALHSIVESQAKLLSKSDIYLNCICPEKIKTTMLRSLPNYDSLNMNEILSPEEVNKVIMTYCDTKEYGQIVYLKKGMKI